MQTPKKEDSIHAHGRVLVERRVSALPGGVRTLPLFFFIPNVYLLWLLWSDTLSIALALSARTT